MVETIDCPTCKGDGKIKLTGVYADTLKGLRRLCRKDGYCVANRHASLFGCNPTALSNRLAWLEKHDFAVSETFGREKRYYAKK